MAAKHEVTPSLARYRWAVASRTVAAVGLGYVLAALAPTLLALLLTHWGMARVDAVMLAGMLAFVVFTVVVIWAFACASARRLWWSLGTATVVLALLLWLVQAWAPPEPTATPGPPGAAQGSASGAAPRPASRNTSALNPVPTPAPAPQGHGAERTHA